MENIKDLKVYTERMKKGLIDKIWFLDYVKFDTLVDFGCADGSLMALVHDINPSIGLVGIDNNIEMGLLVRENCPSAIVYPRIGICIGNTLINMSSVIHEIFSYCGDPDKEMQNIFNSGAKYIAIRDMFWSKKYDGPTQTVNYNKFLDKIDVPTYARLKEFERKYGSISSEKNFIHFLLKYRYVENWNREVKENYFPITLEEFLASIPITYEIIHLEHYTLPFIKQQVKKDFDVDFNIPTHAKILLKRKD